MLPAFWNWFSSDFQANMQQPTTKATRKKSPTSITILDEPDESTEKPEMMVEIPAGRRVKRKLSQSIQEGPDGQLDDDDNNTESRLRRQQDMITRLKSQVTERENEARQMHKAQKEIDGRHNNQIADMKTEMNKQLRDMEQDYKAKAINLSKEIAESQEENAWKEHEIKNQKQEIEAREKDLAKEKRAKEKAQENADAMFENITTELQIKNQELETKNEQLEHKSQQLQNRIQNADQNIQQLVTNWRRLEAGNEDLKEKAGWLKQYLDNAEHQIEELELKDHERENQLQQQEQTIRQAQEAAESMWEQADWTPEADSVIRDELKMLADLVRDFSKRYAYQITEGPDWKEKLEAIKSNRYKRLTDEVWVVLEGRRFGKKAPWLLLSMSLNLFICEQILKKPFCFLRGSDRSSHRQFMEEAIRQCFGDLNKAHGEESRELNTVRSDWLRLYHPRDPEPTDQLVGLVNAVTNAKQASCHALSLQFLTTVPRLLEKASSADQLEELKEIIVRAQDVSLKLGTQRSGLRCENPSVTATFDHTSKVMEAHSLHNKDLADDEAALDGKPIVLVTQPAIIAVGKSDGSDYGVRRVLEKAVVLVG